MAIGCGCWWCVWKVQGSIYQATSKIGNIQCMKPPPLYTHQKANENWHRLSHPLHRSFMLRCSA